jgi:hypothetical protein
MKSDEMSQARSQRRSDDISQSRSHKKSDEKSQSRSLKRSMKDGGLSAKSSQYNDEFSFEESVYIDQAYEEFEDLSILDIL